MSDDFFIDGILKYGLVGVVNSTTGNDASFFDGDESNTGLQAIDYSRDQLVYHDPTIASELENHDEDGLRPEFKTVYVPKTKRTSRDPPNCVKKGILYLQ